jgi:hypothetical protein
MDNSIFWEAAMLKVTSDYMYNINIVILRFQRIFQKTTKHQKLNTLNARGIYAPAAIQNL